MIEILSLLLTDAERIRTIIDCKEKPIASHAGNLTPIESTHCDINYAS
jgi:hypothetical protein